MNYFQDMARISAVDLDSVVGLILKQSPPEFVEQERAKGKRDRLLDSLGGYTSWTVVNIPTLVEYLYPGTRARNRSAQLLEQARKLKPNAPHLFGKSRPINYKELANKYYNYIIDTPPPHPSKYWTHRTLRDFLTQRGEPTATHSGRGNKMLKHIIQKFQSAHPGKALPPYLSLKALATKTSQKLIDAAKAARAAAAFYGATTYIPPAPLILTPPAPLAFTAAPIPTPAPRGTSLAPLAFTGPIPTFTPATIPIPYAPISVWDLTGEA